MAVYLFMYFHNMDVKHFLNLKEPFEYLFLEAFAVFLALFLKVGEPTDEDIANDDDLGDPETLDIAETTEVDDFF